MELHFTKNIRWKSEYQRNNKSKNQKNLRCFPMCCDDFHKPGFCGQAIAVNVLFDTLNFDKNQLVVFGEFQNYDVADFKVGDIINIERNNYNENIPKERWIGTMNGTNHELLRATDTTNPNDMSQEGGCKMTFEFNHKLKGWHYGFVGSKKTREYKHRFSAYVLQVSDAERNTYRVLKSITSPDWKMKCRPRNSNSSRPTPIKCNVKTESKCTRTPLATLPNANGSMYTNRKRTYSEANFTQRPVFTPHFSSTLTSSTPASSSLSIPCLSPKGLSPKEVEEFTENIFSHNPLSPQRRPRLLSKKNSFRMLTKKDSFRDLCRTLSINHNDSFGCMSASKPGYEQPSLIDDCSILFANFA